MVGQRTKVIEVVKALESQILAYAGRKGVQPCDRGDLYQELWVVLLEKQDVNELNDINRVRRWAFGVVNKFVLQWFRGDKRMRHTLGAKSEQTSDARLDEPPDQSDEERDRLHRQLWQSIDALPELSRDYVMEVCLGPEKVKHFAGRRGVPLRTCHRIKTHAVDQLARLMDSADEHGPYQPEDN